jgi:amino acid adenylation domain-containing protein
MTTDLPLQANSMEPKGYTGNSLRRVCEIFDRQVARTPHAIAVHFDGVDLTYQELDRRARNLTGELLKRGTASGTTVGLFLDRSLNMVIAVLAVLKAGAAYVPLDPKYPADRRAYMMKDCGALIFISQSELAGQLPLDRTGIVLQLDRLHVHNEQITGPDVSLEPFGSQTEDSLAYVIYTSGSTGRPKGVAMGNRPLINLLDWQERELPTNVGERTLQFTSLSFDVSFQEMFTTWNGGGTLVLIPDVVRRDPEKLWQYLVDQRINRLFLPFVALNQLAELADRVASLPPLREVITAGEQLHCTPAIRTLFTKLRGARLHNHYGPSETHVVTALTLSGDATSWPVLPSIGRPIDNIDLQILDEDLAPVAPGEIGELFFGGDCLAHGYLGQDELTKQRFLYLQQPRGAEQTPLARYYKTGDLARLLPCGEIEFLGRSDQQVKIRGHRVELGEIEAALRTSPHVKDAVVALRERGHTKVLVAYVLLKSRIDVTTVQLLDPVKQLLPDYMWPAALIVLEQFPLTPSGKVDRASLPAPSSEHEYPEASYVAPVNVTQKAIASVWCEVLGVHRVGISDNFFDLGGTSLTLVNVQQRLNDDLSAHLQISDLFQFPTVGSLAEHLASGDALATSSIAVVTSRAARQRAARDRFRQIADRRL